MKLISILVAIVVTSTILYAKCTFESSNYPGYCLRHKNYEISIARDDGTTLYDQDSTFKMVGSLIGNSDFISFESVNFPDYYIRHKNSKLRIDYYDNSNLYKGDASWKKVSALNGREGYVSFESYNKPGYFMRHQNYGLRISFQKNDDSQLFKDDASFKFIPIVEGCTSWKNFKWLGTEQLFPSESTVIEIAYNNNGPIDQQAGNAAAEQCKQAKWELIQETNYKIGMSLSASAKVSVGEIGGGVEVTVCVYMCIYVVFCNYNITRIYIYIQVSANFGGSEAKKSGIVNSNCLSFDFKSAKCPARYNCKRLVKINDVKEKTKQFEATLICPGLELPYKGTIKINGGFDVSYDDKSIPINCLYYTHNYNDRNDKQPYCDHCSSSNNCDSCEQNYYLIQNGDRRECINFFGCQTLCDGTPDNSVNSESQCKNANVTRIDCQKHLVNKID